MAVDLILRIPAGGDEYWAWCDPQAGTAGLGDPAEAGEAAAGCRVHLVVPGDAVLVTRVAVPAGQRSRALAAIPWALEDRLAQDVDALHFALGAQAERGEWSVAVVARAAMEDWLERCRRAGIQPVSMRPEPLALPRPQAGEWVVLEEPGRVVARTGAHGGFACESELLGVVVATLEPPERLRRLGDGGTAWPDAVAPRAGEPEHLAAPVCAFALPHDDIDLLQGAYSRRERTGRRLRRWRVPAVIVLLLLAVTGVRLGAEYAAMGQREAALRERLQSTFQQAFPDVQRVSDPRAQMAARLQSLREGGGGAGFADILARTGGVLAGESGVRLQGLTWRGGTLELELAADELPALDRVQRGLADAGLASELRGAERSEKGIEGRITVTEGAA